MSFVPPIVALIVALLVTRGLISVSPRLGLVDVPNERSLHWSPIPTVGGIAVLLGAGAAIGTTSMLPLFDQADSTGFWLVSAVLLVLVRDELKAMRWGAKLGLQVGISVVLSWLLGLGFPSFEGFSMPLAVLLLVYLQNIYNFMDGLDGLSGLVGCVAGAILYVVYAPVSLELSSMCLAVSAASLGFVVWNVPPARIFMGDVGAHFLGLFFGWVALAGETEGIPFYVTLLPIGPFLYDGTYTIGRRVIRRENITQAHLFHLYQRLRQSGWSAIQIDCVYVAWTGLCGLTALSHQSGTGARWLVMLLAVTAISLTVFVESRWAGNGETR